MVRSWLQFGLQSKLGLSFEVQWCAVCRTVWATSAFNCGKNCRGRRGWLRRRSVRGRLEQNFLGTLPFFYRFFVFKARMWPFKRLRSSTLSQFFFSPIKKSVGPKSVALLLVAKGMLVWWCSDFFSSQCLKNASKCPKFNSSLKKVPFNATTCSDSKLICWC